MKKIFLPLLLTALLLFTACSTNPGTSVPSAYIITSPYSGIDWEEYGQYKTALHVHTTNSDGKDTFSDVIENHYEKDFDIVAITDHNALTVDWVSVKNGLTQKRFDEIAAGEGRNGRGMLQIPHTNEQSRADHMNTFFTDFNNAGGAALKGSLEKTEELDGISHINHPGRYTGGQTGGAAGEAASNNSQNIEKYVDLFMEFPSCAGMEIINKKDGESASDRVLWDNILMQTIPQGRHVWGFSNDDTHSNNDTGFSFNIFVMPENTLENFKSAMRNGNFYAVAKVSKHELGASFFGAGPVPVIKNILVDNDDASITITAENYSRIEWISDGKIIAEGNTIKPGSHGKKTGCYVRANIMGPGGIAFTQPFGIESKQ